MTETTESPLFEGIYCPSITVTDEHGQMDFDLWGRHLDHLVEAGVDGVLVFGSIGEFYSFTLFEKMKAIQFAGAHLAGRCQLLVGVGSTSMDETITLCEAAERAGAAAVVAVCPYYFGPSDDAAIAYYQAIAASCSLPIILYNFPARTGNDLSPELVSRIVATVPQVKGIKDTVDTISHTRKVIAAVRPMNPGFSVLSGFDEYYLPNRIAGGNGVLCGLTNVEPETLVAMHRAYQAGDMDKAVACAARVSKLMELYDQADLFISAVKGGVKAKGLPICTRIAEPAVQLTDEQYAAVEALLG